MYGDRTGNQPVMLQQEQAKRPGGTHGTALLKSVQKGQILMPARGHTARPALFDRLDSETPCVALFAHAAGAAFHSSGHSCPVLPPAIVPGQASASEVSRRPKPPIKFEVPLSAKTFCLLQTHTFAAAHFRAARQREDKKRHFR